MSTNSIAARQFKEELKQLLEKHNATISFSHTGDSTDIYDECIEITCRPNLKSFKEYTLVSVPGYSIEPNDLKPIEPMYTVMGKNDWPESNQKDFAVIDVLPSETFQNAINRAKKHYDDVEFYIVNQYGEIVYE